MNLPPIPRPNIADKAGFLLAPWQSWFSQLYYFVTRSQLTASAASSLPTATPANLGGRYLVVDATATTFASIVAGGGANTVPVYSDGTNWRIG